MILKKISHLIALTRDWRLDRMTISFNNRSWEFIKENKIKRKKNSTKKKRKQGRKQKLDQESDQEKKKTRKKTRI